MSTLDILVQKFGGSSLTTVDRIHLVAGRVSEAHRAGHATVVVVSARGSTTDELLQLATEVGSVPPCREVDQLVSTGENSAAAQLAMALHEAEVPAISLTGNQVGVTATGRYGGGVITTVDTGRILELLRDEMVVVVAGFQGIDTAGDVLTLGRGGSDTTAVALAAELRAARCEICTDVDGVFTADPRIVSDARRLPFVDAGVMAEMAFTGANVLHSRAIELAAMNEIELHVRNTFSQDPGTIISRGRNGEMLENAGAVIAVTHDLDVARVIVRSQDDKKDLVGDVLDALGQSSVPVDLVAQPEPAGGEFTMTFTVRRSNVEAARQALDATVTQPGGAVEINEDIGKISMVGMGLLSRPEYTTRLLSTLAAAGVPARWISATQQRISVTVPMDQVTDAVNMLHQEFELERDTLDLDPVVTTEPGERKQNADKPVIRQ